MSLYRFSFAMLALLAPLAHGAAICDDTMDRTAPSARFLDHGNGTVTDQHTGLTWMRCKLGQTWSGNSCLGGTDRLLLAAGVASGGADPQ